MSNWAEKFRSQPPAASQQKIQRRGPPRNNARSNRAPQRQQPRQQQQRQAPAPQAQRPQARPPVKPVGWSAESILNPGELFCKVRKIMSGDTVRLETNLPGNDGQFKLVNFMLVLDSIQTPRVSRSKNDYERDLHEEAFAYEAREYLRGKLISGLVRVQWRKEVNAAISEKVDQSYLFPDPKDPGRMRRVFGDMRVVETNPRTKLDQMVHGIDENWISVKHMLVRDGWAMVKDIPSLRDNFDHQQLQALEEQSRAMKLGRHQDIDYGIGKHLRVIDWDPVPLDLFKQFQGKDISAVVEDVREGSTVRLELTMPSDGKSIRTAMIWMAISGIQSEKMPKPVPVQRREFENQKKEGRAKTRSFVEEKANIYAIDAKKNVERRLLHQTVTVRLEKIDTVNNGKLYGSISFGNRDIAQFLLRQGLSRTVGWHMNPEKAQSYASFEDFARTRGAGIWKEKSGHKPKPKRKAEAGKWMCSQVFNADCVKLVNPETKKSKRVYLASLKAPRTANPRMKTAPEKCSFEAKEFVRTRLVGNYVTVAVAYTRKGTRGDELLEYVSIRYKREDGSEQDISLELVEAGFADLVRTNETDRVSTYFELTKAKDQAMEKKVGIWMDDSKYKWPKIKDLTLSGGRPSSQKEKQEREKQETRIRRDAIKMMVGWGLQDNVQSTSREERRNRNRDRGGRKLSQDLEAVVEFVFTSTRMKIRLVEDNVKVIMLLSGITGIRSNEQVDEKRRKIRDQTTDWVRDQIQQRTVFVQIESLDKFANFVGHLKIKTGPRSARNVGLELLKMGAVKVFAPSAERSPHYKSLMAAEKEGRDQRLGLWEDWKEPVKEEEVEAESDNQQQQSKSPSKPQQKERPQKDDMENVTVLGRVTSVESATEFFMTRSDEKGKKLLDEVEGYMRTITPATNPWTEDFNPQQRDIVAGLFDGSYYRCMVSSISKKTGKNIYHVSFLDYGNRGKLTEAQILPLSRTNNGKREGDNIKSIKALAIRCRLAGLKPPPVKNKNYCDQAGQFFASYAYTGEDVKIKILKVLNHRGWKQSYEVELYSQGLNVNEVLAESGYARVDPKNYTVWGGGRSKAPNPFPAKKKRLLELCKSAQDTHRGMYEFGHVDSDDED